MYRTFFMCVLFLSLFLVGSVHLVAQVSGQDTITAPQDPKEAFRQALERPQVKELTAKIKESATVRRTEMRNVQMVEMVPVRQCYGLFGRRSRIVWMQRVVTRIQPIEVAESRSRIDWSEVDSFDRAYGQRNILLSMLPQAAGAKSSLLLTSVSPLIPGQNVPEVGTTVVVISSMDVSPVADANGNRFGYRLNMEIHGPGDNQIFATLGVKGKDAMNQDIADVNILNAAINTLLGQIAGALQLRSQGT